jgi:hypothetical protein
MLMMYFYPPKGVRTNGSATTVPGKDYRISKTSVLLKVLLEFNECKAPETAQIVIYPVRWWIQGHGGDILKIVKVILVEFNLKVIEFLDTLALIHISRFCGSRCKSILYIAHHQIKFSPAGN